MKQKKSEEIKLDLNGKKVLITQPIICGINGSTVVTLELAEYFMSLGAKVVVYTCSYDEPAKTFYKAKGIEVVVAKDNPRLHIADFEYIWVNSQILPESIVDDLRTPQNARFVYSHMSGVAWVPDERPWIYGLEEKTASLRLFISEETKNNNSGFVEGKIPELFYRNPAPDAFGLMRSRKKGETPKKVLIVSNHPPAELLEAKKLLQKQGIKVTSLGENSDKYELITPKHVGEVDVVVTIGKTVQYCLVSSTPVYIYDYYGGPGYLNNKNYNQARELNFSGRGMRKKDAETIAKEIIGGYRDGVKFLKENKSHFDKDYLAGNVMPRILKKAKMKKIEPLEEKYIKSIVLSQEFATQRFESVAALRKMDVDYKKIIKEYDDKVKELVHNYDNLVKSTTWKIGKAIMTPIAILKKLRK